MTAPPVLSPFTADTVPEPDGQHPGSRAGKVTITPETARAWMDRHKRVVESNRVANSGRARDNRPVRWSDVAAYARDMKAGKWRCNGETVKIARDETVTDGQHRLYACMQAEVPFTTWVIFGTDPDDQDTVDTGNRRRLSDQLAIAGEANTMILASVTRWSLRWLHGVRGGTAAGGGGNAVFQPTQAEMLEYLAHTPHLRDAAAFANRARQSFKSVRSSVYAMAWILFNGCNPVAAQVFFDRVLDGAGLPQGSPVLAFRERIRHAVEDGERLSEAEQLALMITAWNAFREDRQVHRLLLPKGGLTARNFPEPKLPPPRYRLPQEERGSSGGGRQPRGRPAPGVWGRNGPRFHGNSRAAAVKMAAAASSRAARTGT